MSLKKWVPSWDFHSAINSWVLFYSMLWCHKQNKIWLQVTNGPLTSCMTLNSFCPSLYTGELRGIHTSFFCAAYDPWANLHEQNSLLAWEFHYFKIPLLKWSLLYLANFLSSSYFISNRSAGMIVQEIICFWMATVMFICWGLKLISKPFTIFLYVLCVYLAYVYLHVRILSVYKNRTTDKEDSDMSIFLLYYSWPQTLILSFLPAPLTFWIRVSEKQPEVLAVARQQLGPYGSQHPALWPLSLFLSLCCHYVSLCSPCILSSLPPPFPDSSSHCPCNLPPSFFIFLYLYKRKQDSLIRIFFCKNYF